MKLKELVQQAVFQGYELYREGLKQRDESSINLDKCVLEGMTKSLQVFWSLYLENQEEIIEELNEVNRRYN